MGQSGAVPASVVEAARAAFDALDMQVELAPLITDSWDASAAPDVARILSFSTTGGDVSVVMTVPAAVEEPVTFRVQPAPDGVVRVHVHGQPQADASVGPDGVGTVGVRPTAPVRVEVDTAGRRVTTAWVRV